MIAFRHGDDVDLLYNNDLTLWCVLVVGAATDDRDIKIQKSSRKILDDIPCWMQTGC